MELIRKPDWTRIRIPSGDNYLKIKRILDLTNLHTVCEEANCPNIAECWGTGTATIMIMGDTCTRGCRFCSVNSGKPMFLDPEEPRKVAKAVKEWGLRYVVITAVCRDDLDDGGAEHMARTIKEVRTECPQTIVEPLIPDYQGSEYSIRKIINSQPQVISHNVETVRRLTPKVRDARASYEQTLNVLKMIKTIDSRIYTKSSIMVGLGEREIEVIQTMQDLKKVGVDILTIGHYLQPTVRHLPVVEYVAPEKFRWYKKYAEKMEFSYVVTGPLVRSSYKAGELFIEKITRCNIDSKKQ
jgi:lipoic acid synthetase